MSSVFCVKSAKLGCNIKRGYRVKYIFNRINFFHTKLKINELNPFSIDVTNAFNRISFEDDVFNGINSYFNDSTYNYSNNVNPYQISINENESNYIITMNISNELNSESIDTSYDCESKTVTIKARMNEYQNNDVFQQHCMYEYTKSFKLNDMDTNIDHLCGYIIDDIFTIQIPKVNDNIAK
mmetsp:Transcript_31903/g.39195  ORF Transcript_31903/g.39195 Transcript_31903/m.39195 type:complete len:182 (-) Transcript_31903:51-596(-)